MLRNQELGQPLASICLVDPSNCIQIPDLLAELKDTKNLRPAEIYLKHCQEYASANFKKNKLPHKDYKFTLEDIDKGLLREETASELRPDTPDQGGDPEDSGSTLEKSRLKSAAPSRVIEQIYTSLSHQFFCQFHFIQSEEAGESGTHYLVIKTWQKMVRTSKRSQSTQPRAQKGSAKATMKGSQSKSTKYLKEKDASHSKTRAPPGTATRYAREATSTAGASQFSAHTDGEDSFFIKTICVYDHNMQLRAEILVEQVRLEPASTGSPADPEPYDTSTLANGRYLYYFKRIHDASPCCPSLNADEKEYTNVGKKQEYTTLRLFRYDFIDGQEQEVGTGCSEARTPPQKCTSECKASHRYYHKDELDEQKYHIMFSKEFGNEQSHLQANLGKGHRRSDIEDSFLPEQFVILQPYRPGRREKENKAGDDNYRKRRKNQPEWEISSMRSLHSSFLDLKPFNNFQMGQAEFLFHIKQGEEFSKPPDEKKSQITFIMSDLKSIGKIVAHREAEQIERKDLFQCNDTISRIRNPIQIQYILLSVANDNDQVDEKGQYYFVDQNNKIQLLYPLYAQKIGQQKTIELISEQAQIDPKVNNFNQYKQISCIWEHPEQPHSQNVFQPVEHLKKILNEEELTQDQLLTYLKDDNDEVLMIQTVNTDRNELVYMVLEEEEGNEDHAELVGPQTHMRLSVKNAAQPDKGATGLRQIRSKQEPNHDTLIEKLTEHQDSLCSDEVDQPQILYSISSQKRYQEKATQQHTELNRPENQVALLNYSHQKIMVATHATIPDGQGVSVILLMYQKCLGFAQFVFAVADEDGMRSYVFVRKTDVEMLSIFSSKGKIPIMLLDQKVLVLTGSGDIRNPKKLPPKSQSCCGWLQKGQWSKEKFPQLAGSQKTQRGASRTLARDKDVHSEGSGGYSDDRSEVKDDGSGLREEQPKIQLTFQRFQNQNELLNFIPFVYDQQGSPQKSRLLVFDIISESIVTTEQIGPQPSHQKYMCIDKLGFNQYQLCRSSDIEEKNLNQKPDSPKLQIAKFTLATYYNERLGRIRFQTQVIQAVATKIIKIKNGKEEETGQQDKEKEEEVKYEIGEAKIKIVGHQEVFFSTQLIQRADFHYTRNSQVIPWHEPKGGVKGCQLAWFCESSNERDQLRETFENSVINLLDQETNNIYDYASQLVTVGQKKFILDNERAQRYAVVISAQLRKHIVETDIFKNNEAYSLLSMATELVSGMKLPDLGNLVLNSFDKIKQKEFFIKQEILHGKSFCDISINEPNQINDAIESYPQQQHQPIGSSIDNLCAGDNMRRDIMRETGHLQEVLILGIDFNFNGTIRRALDLRSYKALQYLLDYILEKLNTFNYQSMIMFDLVQIIKCNKIQIYEFFGQSRAESKGGEDQLCNVEILLKSNQLPVFSDKQFEHVSLTQLDDFHLFEHEIKEVIIQREKEKQSGNDFKKNFEVQHSYIDFQRMILGQKIQELQQMGKIKNIIRQEGQRGYQLNHYELSQLMLRDDDCLDFYKQRTIQDIIAIQWETTRKMTIGQFWIYLLLFCIPFYLQLLCVEEMNWFEAADPADEKAHLEAIRLAMLKICFIPELMLMFIEGVQIRCLGLRYFVGWNILDVLQIAAFFTFAIGRLMGWLDDDGSHNYIPAFKMVILLLSFSKLQFFQRIWETQGLLYQMLMSCIVDVIPFIAAYFTLLALFSCCFHVLGLQISVNMAPAKDLGDFMTMFIQTYLLTLEYLYVPGYSNITGPVVIEKKGSTAEEGFSFSQSSNIFFIWFLWFFLTFLVNIMMINFIVAVISATFERVQDYQLIITFKQKAELNFESYQLLNMFGYSEQFVVLALSTSKEVDQTKTSPYTETAAEIIKFMSKENQELRQSYESSNQDLEAVVLSNEFIKQKFTNSQHELAQRQVKMTKQIVEEMSKALGRTQKLTLLHADSEEPVCE